MPQDYRSETEPGVRGSLVATNISDPAASKARADKRRFRRVRVDLPGKLFLPEERLEIACTVIDLSPGGAQIRCEQSTEAATSVVLYVDWFGRFEGHIARRDGFDHGVRFVSTALKRERTAEQLTLYMNRTLMDNVDLRRHDRTPSKGFTRFTRADGQLVPCEVLDLSMSGISLKTGMKPPIGEFVLIGQMAGRIARHHDNGIGIEFVGGVNTSADRIKKQLSLSR